MQQQREQLAEDKLKIALSMKEMTPEFLALLEYIAIQDFGHTFLTIYQQDELARVLMHHDRVYTVMTFLADTPTALEHAQHLGAEEERLRRFVPKKVNWLKNLFSLTSRMNSSPP